MRDAQLEKILRQNDITGGSRVKMGALGLTIASACVTLKIMPNEAVPLMRALIQVIEEAVPVDLGDIDPSLEGLADQLLGESR